MLAVMAPDRDLAPLLAFIQARPYADRVHLRPSSLCHSPRTSLPHELDRPDADTHVHLSGPPGFTQHVGDHARRAGRPDVQLYQESFTLEAEARAALSAGDECTVRVASSGGLYHVCCPRARTAELTLGL